MYQHVKSRVNFFCVSRVHASCNPPEPPCSRSASTVSGDKEASTRGITARDSAGFADAGVRAVIAVRQEIRFVLHIPKKMYKSKTYQIHPQRFSQSVNDLGVALLPVLQRLMMELGVQPATTLWPLSHRPHVEPPCGRCRRALSTRALTRRFPPLPGL